MIHVAVEQCQKGDVLVVGCTADNTDGMFGELLATALRARRRRRAPRYRCRLPRRSTDLRNEISVWSKAISAKGTVKSTLGAVSVPVVCAGVNVEPGDVVVADDDGVVVIPGARRRNAQKARSVRMTRMANASNSKRARSASTLQDAGAAEPRQDWCTRSFG